MTRRSGDWELVGHASDPVPASEWDVLRVRREYTDRASDLRSAHSLLRGLSQLSEWQGEAAEEFAKKASERLEDLSKAEDKYDDVADALLTYSTAVDTARTETWDALRRATDADSTRRANDGDPLRGVAEPTPEQLSSRDDQWDRRDQAADDLQAARNDVDDALDRLDEAASRCESKIRAASESFSDSWWSDVKGWIRDHADLIKAIVEVLKWVAVAVAAIGIIVALFFTAPFWLTALLIGAGIGLAALILIGDAMLLSVGEATWGDIAWDVAGLALSFVGGRAAIQGLRGIPAGLARARTTVVAAQQSRAASSLPRHVQWIRGANQRFVPAFFRNYANARHTAALDDAAAEVTQLLSRTSASRLSRVLRLDSELATQMAQLRALRSFNVAAADEALSGVEHLVRNVTLANWTGVTTAVDELSGLVFDWSPSDLPKGLIDESIDEIGDHSWRLSTVP